MNAKKQSDRKRDQLFAKIDQSIEAHRRKDYAGAITILEAILKEFPGTKEALNNLAVNLRAVGRIDDALKIYGELTANHPDSLDGFYNYGNALFAVRRHSDALEAYRAAVSLSPAHKGAALGMVAALRALKRGEEALALLEGFARHHPGGADLWLAFGATLFELGRFDAAIPCLRRALAIEPKNAEAAANLSIALYQRAHFVESAEKAAIGVVLQSGNLSARAQLAQSLIATRQYSLAREILDDLLKAEPDHLDGRLARARVALLQGDFRQGWIDYEWRWKRPTADQPKFAQPRWRGENVKGKRILLWMEQGIGDALQFIRFAKILADMGAIVSSVVHPSIVSVVSTVPGLSHVARDGGRVPEFDYHVPMLSVPGILGTDLKSIPRPAAYMKIPKNVAVPEPLKSAPRDAVRVGIIWAGNPAHGNDYCRTIGLKPFLELLAQPGIRLFSLQVGETAKELGGLRADCLIEDLGKNLKSFADTAAALGELDLLVSVDTSTIHLAGALGRPVWALIPFAPDWRWMTDFEETTPWYPSMRLFRQSSPNRWGDVFERIQSALRKTTGR